MAKKGFLTARTPTIEVNQPGPPCQLSPLNGRIEERELEQNSQKVSLPQEELKKNKETSTASKPTSNPREGRRQGGLSELELMQVILKLKLAPNTQAFLFTKGLTSQVNSKNLPT